MFDGVTTTPDFSHSLYTQYMNKPVTAGNQYLYGLERRRKSEWALFQTGYYGYETDMHEWYREGGGAVVEEALSHLGEGYSKFGLANHWCAQFVSYCFDKCGLIPSALTRWYTYVPTGISDAKANGTYRESNSGYVPKSGDIIFFDWQGDRNDGDHTGIVTDCDGTTVYTVEGNAQDLPWSQTYVQQKEWPITSSSIIRIY